MAKVLSLRPPPVHFNSAAGERRVHRNWSSLQLSFKCNGKYTCLFSDNRKQEEARKALEGALGGKKNEFEKWNKEIKKREEQGGGGSSGGGGWFGRWFGGSNGDHFWQEAQQASLAVLGILVLYLVVSKGDKLLAIVFNPLLFALRGTRNGITFITSRILEKVSPGTHANFDNALKNEYKQVPASAKDNVIRKWRTA